MRRIMAATALLATLALGGCIAPINKSVEIAPGPDTQRIVTKEDALLVCYAQTPWARKSPVWIGAAKVPNVTGKVMYGDYGTGSMLPLDSGTTLIQALSMARNRNYMKVADRLDLSVQEVEVKFGIRTQEQVVKNMRPVDYVITGDSSGLDALGGAAAQMVAYGFGGGPRQERWDVQLNLRIVGLPSTEVLDSVSVHRQYVQDELALMVGTTMKAAGREGLVTADVEGIRRTLLQGIVRQLLYPATASLLGSIKGAPQGCLANVNAYLDENNIQLVHGGGAVAAVTQ